MGHVRVARSSIATIPQLGVGVPLLNSSLAGVNPPHKTAMLLEIIAMCLRHLEVLQAYRGAWREW